MRTKRNCGLAAVMTGRRILTICGTLFAVTCALTTNGQVWNQIRNAVPEDSVWSSIASSYDGSVLVAAQNPGTIITSTNSGATWLATGVQSNDWIAVACSADGKRQVAVAGKYNGGGPIYVSTDYGITWLPTPAPTNTWSSVACSADGLRILAGAVNSTVFESTNGGANWQPINLAWVCPAVACSASGAKIIVGTGNYVFLSDDFGNTWTAAGAVSNAFWSSVACSSNGLTLVAATRQHYTYTEPDGLAVQDFAICCSTDGGVTWNANFLNDNISWDPTTAVSGDGKKIEATYPLNTTILVSTDGGTDFSPMFGQPGTSPDQAATFSYDGSIGYALQWSGAIYKARFLPPLNIIQVGAGLSVSWQSLMSSRGLALVQKADLNGTVWAPVETAPLLTNGCYSVSISPSNTQGYYSLSGP